MRCREKVINVDDECSVFVVEGPRMAKEHQATVTELGHQCTGNICELCTVLQ